MTDSIKKARGSGQKIPGKIVDRKDLGQILDSIRRERKCIVFTNGCFDIMHAGHVRYLAAARAAGDVLLVGLNTDRSVTSIKGKKRPIVPQQERAEMLAALECVDYVTLFDEKEPLDLIGFVSPHVLAKGADWGENHIVGADVVKADGGKVFRVPLVSGVSTTWIIERIIRRYG